MSTQLTINGKLHTNDAMEKVDVKAYLILVGNETSN